MVGNASGHGRRPVTWSIETVWFAIAWKVDAVAVQIRETLSDRRPAVHHQRGLCVRLGENHEPPVLAEEPGDTLYVLSVHRLRVAVDEVQYCETIRDRGQTVDRLPSSFPGTYQPRTSPKTTD